jgi:integrase
VKTWTLFYRVDGKQVRQSLGRYPAVSLADARKKAGDVQDMLDAGKDPRLEAERERRESAEARANTVKSVANRFFVEIGATEAEPDKAKRKGRRKREPLKTAKEVKRTIERFLLAKFGERPIGDVTRRELIALFDDIADENGPIAANRALAWVKRFFKWSVGKDYIDANPAADIEKPGEERKGDRVLTDVEIREVWAAAGSLGYPYGHYVKALLLTGRRRTSVATMRQSEIDASRRVWAPGGGTANKGVPELPLSTALEALLASIPEQKIEGGDYVFSTRLARDTALNSFTAVKADLDAAIAKTRKAAGVKEPMPDWIIHDLRRTCKTGLAELGVPKEMRDLILGHARAGMDAVYDHSERREDKRDGLERWGRHLDAIFDPSPANLARCGCNRCNAQLDPASKIVPLLMQRAAN